MAHYIDADKLKAEIERQLKLDTEYGSNVYDVCSELLSFIDSLQQEQPEVELEEEIESWIPAHIKGNGDSDVEKIVHHVKDWGKDIARHFAEWESIHLNARNEK